MELDYAFISMFEKWKLKVKGIIIKGDISFVFIYCFMNSQIEEKKYHILFSIIFLYDLPVPSYSILL